MNKKMYVWLVVALMAVPASAMAQEIIEVVDIEMDTVAEDEIADEKLKITQYDLSECDRVDICYNPKYAVVTKDGKKGLYDMIEHRNITDIIYRDLGFSRQTIAEDSVHISMSYATMGIKRGIVSVYDSAFVCWLFNEAVSYDYDIGE